MSEGLAEGHFTAVGIIGISGVIIGVGVGVTSGIFSAEQARCPKGTVRPRTKSAKVRFIVFLLKICCSGGFSIRLVVCAGIQILEAEKFFSKRLAFWSTI